jgi:hypothetical protein
MPFIKQAQTYFAALYPVGGASSDKARINLYCVEDYKLYILFRKEPLPPNSYNTASKTGVAYVDIDQYPNYIDLVRNEKPISVTFNPDVAPPSFVVHANETVGEGEV